MPETPFGTSPQGAPPADRQSRIRGGRSMAFGVMHRSRFGAVEN